MHTIHRPLLTVVQESHFQILSLWHKSSPKSLFQRHARLSMLLLKQFKHL